MSRSRGRQDKGWVTDLSDLLRGLALDHVGDSLAADIKQRLDIQVVGSQDDLEKHFLIDRDAEQGKDEGNVKAFSCQSKIRWSSNIHSQLGVPVGDLRRPSSVLISVVVGRSRHGVLSVVLGVLKNLFVYAR